MVSCGSDGVLKAHTGEDFAADAEKEFTPTNSDTIHAFALANQVARQFFAPNIRKAPLTLSLSLARCRLTVLFGQC